MNPYKLSDFDKRLRAVEWEEHTRYKERLKHMIRVLGPAMFLSIVSEAIHASVSDIRESDRIMDTIDELARSTHLCTGDRRLKVNFFDE